MLRTVTVSSVKTQLIYCQLLSVIITTFIIDNKLVVFWLNLLLHYLSEKYRDGSNLRKKENFKHYVVKFPVVRLYFFLFNSKISNQRNFYYYLYELMRRF